MEIDVSKPIEFSPHAREKMLDRGASENEVRFAIRTGNPEPARKGRIMFRKNFAFNSSGVALSRQGGNIMLSSRWLPLSQKKLTAWLL